MKDYKISRMIIDKGKKTKALVRFYSWKEGIIEEEQDDGSIKSFPGMVRDQVIEEKWVEYDEIDKTGKTKPEVIDEVRSIAKVELDKEIPLKEKVTINKDGYVEVPTKTTRTLESV